MIEDGPSYASCKKSLCRGCPVTLPGGEKGTFRKTRKSMCEVENSKGMLTCVTLAGLMKATFGVERKGK